MVSPEYFVELEDCELKAEANRFSDPDHVEVLLKPSRLQVLDKNEKTVSEMSDMNSILLVVSENPVLFWELIYPMFKNKKPMMNDNQTDLESFASFCTVNSVLKNHDKEYPDINSKPSTEKPLAEGNFNISEELFTSSEPEVPGAQMVKMEQKIKSEPEIRQTTKVEPQVFAKCHLYRLQPISTVYDDVPCEEKELPPPSKFLAQKRIE
jgi:hypothetical protein